MDVDEQLSTRYRCSEPRASTLPWTSGRTALPFDTLEPGGKTLERLGQSIEASSVTTFQVITVRPSRACQDVN